MIIGFDAKRAMSNMTGLGNYSRLVIGALGEENPNDRLLMYTPKMTDNPRLAKIRQLPNVEFHLPPGLGFKGSLWRTFGVTNNLRADGVELYHGLSNELPLNIASSGVPSVVTIHDVIYRRMPECYKLADRIIYDFKYGRSCRAADRVIAVSECTKRDVVELYGVDPERIDVVYQGCDDSFKRIWSPEEIAALRKRYDLPAKFILQVGTIERRKNLELTVRALTSLPQDIALVAVGKDHYGYLKYVMGIAREAGVASRIKIIPGIDFADLPGLNQAAEVVAYPSHYEGFGIPILEGLCSRRPVVAATGSCLEEAGGENSLYVDPHSPRDMAAALIATLRGGRDVEEMVKAGLEHAEKFDNRNMGGLIRDVYQRTIADFQERTEGKKQEKIKK